MAECVTVNTVAVDRSWSGGSAGVAWTSRPHDAERSVDREGIHGSCG